MQGGRNPRRGGLYGAFVGVGVVVALHSNIGLLAGLLRPAAFLQFLLLLLVSTFLPRGGPRPLGLMVPEFHWAAVPLADLLLVAVFALAGCGFARLRALLKRPGR